MIHFSERQRFSQPWIWFILFAYAGFVIFSVYLQAGNTGQKVNPLADPAILISLIGMVAIFTMFIFIRLDTLIQPDGIYYRFFPVHRKFRKIEWKDVRYVYTRKYHPVMEYGGWGMRVLNLFGKGKAYNISGDKGLQIVFTNDKRLLLGTRKMDELEKILRELGKWNAENV